MSGLSRRVIPSLLMDRGRLVKTTGFMKPVYVGDPINTIRVFNDKGCDELLLLDIGAGERGEGPDIETVRSVASECFMPLAYGGGITSLEHAETLFACGVEKLVIRTSARQQLSLVSDLADRFGSQAVVVSIDVDRDRAGRLAEYPRSSTIAGEADPMDRMRSVVDAGAGEVMVQSVPADGMLSGPDRQVVELLSGATVPTIYGGGVASIADMGTVFEAGVDAVAVGAHFVFYGPHRAVLITYPTAHELAEIGVRDA